MRREIHMGERDWAYLIKKVEELRADGVPVAEATQRLGITVAQYYRRKSKIVAIQAQDG